MKKCFFAFTATVIFTVFSMKTNAQKAINNSASNEFQNASAFRTPKIFDGESGTATGLNAIPIKAMRDFKKRYAGVNETWIIKDGFLARFSENAVTTTICYNKNGKWMYSIQRYNETKLPMDVRATVKSIYYDYTITHAKEISLPGKTVFLVYLQCMIFDNLNSNYDLNAIVYKVKV